MQKEGFEEKNDEGEEEKQKEDEVVEVESALGKDFEEEEPVFPEGKSKAEGDDQPCKVGLAQE